MPITGLKKFNENYGAFFWAGADSLYNDPQYKKLWDHKKIYLPYDAIDELFSHSLTAKAKPEEDNKIAFPYAAALAGWRVDKAVYDFDPILTEKLYRQGEKGNPKFDLFHLVLPTFTPYIRTDGFDTYIGFTVDGFFVHFDCGGGEKGEDQEIRFVPVSDEGETLPPIYLIFTKRKQTLDELINNTIDNLKRFSSTPKSRIMFLQKFYQENKTIIRHCLNLSVYLGSSRANIERMKNISLSEQKLSLMQKVRLNSFMHILAKDQTMP